MSSERKTAVKFCLDDACALKSSPTNIGIVERTEYDVDSHDPDPQSDYDTEIKCHEKINSDAFSGFLGSGIPPRGTVLITMASYDHTELIPETELELLDRRVVLGDIVRRSAESAMSGTVINSRTVCVLLDSSKVEDRHGRDLDHKYPDDRKPFIGGVIGEDIEVPHKYLTGDVIVFYGWIGKVIHIRDEITLSLLSDSLVIPHDLSELERLYSKAHDRICPGDTVVTKKSNLRRGRWLKGAYDPNTPPSGKVMDVQTDSIEVNWFCRSPNDGVTSGYHEIPPPTHIPRHILDEGLVHVYDRKRQPTAHTTDYRWSPDYQINERVRFKDIDAAVLKYDGSDKLKTPIPQIGRPEKKAPGDHQGYDMNIFVVMKTERLIQVQWQDLSVTSELSTDLIPDPHIDDENEVWPGDIVCASARSEPSGDPTRDEYLESNRVGVIQLVKPNDRIAHVRWCSGAKVMVVGDDLLPGSTTGVAEGEIDVVSIYDIQPLEALNRRRGELVMISDINSLAADHPLRKDIIPRFDMWWLGEVIQTDPDGQVVVRLGLLEEVVDVRLPVESMVVIYHARDLEGSTTSYDSESMSEELPHIIETPAHPGIVSDDPPRYEYNYDGGERMDEDSEDAWSTETEDGSKEPSRTVSSGAENHRQLSSAGVMPPSTTPGKKQCQEGSTQASAEAGQGLPLEKDSDVVSTSDITNSHNESVNNTTWSRLGQAQRPLMEEKPPRFAVLEGQPPSDHHYKSRRGGVKLDLKRINREHKILRTSLPDNIFVRTWDSRLDLLRVLIIGPNDTPYEFAPFVIDFFLGPDYPNEPPDAFFHSWTDRKGPINPNLYEDGKICLSLLGTWHTMNPEEEWTGSRSTLLQVLVSLMGLVLVKEPYYNEAGFEVRVGTSDSRLQSALYSERVYFRSRSFILHALEFPVKGLDDVVIWLYAPSKPPSTDVDAMETETSSLESPGLLDRAIEAARGLVSRSEMAHGDGGIATGQDARDGDKSGFRTISRGAVIPLKRQVEALGALRKKFDVLNEA